MWQRAKLDTETVAEALGMFLVVLPFSGAAWWAGYLVGGWVGFGVAVLLWPWPVLWLGVKKL